MREFVDLVGQHGGSLTEEKNFERDLFCKDF